MAVYELITQFVTNIFYIVIASLTAYLGVEHHVEQNIAQFLADIRLAVLHYGITEFINLLNGVLATINYNPTRLISDRISSISRLQFITWTTPP